MRMPKFVAPHTTSAPVCNTWRANHSSRYPVCVLPTSLLANNDLDYYHENTQNPTLTCFFRVRLHFVIGIFLFLGAPAVKSSFFGSSFFSTMAYCSSSFFLALAARAAFDLGEGDRLGDFR